MPEKRKQPDDKIVIENVIQPGHTYRVDRAKYEAMRDALLAVLPGRAPGLTVAEAKAALLPNLSEALFPGGAKTGWWLKAAQLDLEAKGTIRRGRAARSACSRHSQRGLSRAVRLPDRRR